MSVTDIAKRTIHFANEHKIALIPANYRVIYEYFAGQNIVLKNTVDRHIKQEDPFTQEILDEIYDNFFGSSLADDTTAIIQKEIKTATEVTEKAGKIIADAIKRIIAGVKDSSEYGTKLDTYGKKAEKVSSVDDIRHLLELMVRDTADITAKNCAFKNELQASETKLDHLGKQLEAAKGEARIDPLTKTFNRRHFNEAMLGAIKYVMSENDCSLIMIDIDNFKKFNDTWGHAYGDLLLKGITEKMKWMISERCTLCRYGGEEFAIICFGMKLSSARELAEKVRSSIWEWEFKINERKVPVSASFGVAEINGGDDLESPVKRADKALYFAKSEGKNKVKTEKDL